MAGPWTRLAGSMPRLCVLLASLVPLSLAVLLLAVHAPRGERVEPAFLCAEHACGCRDAEACLRDCCCAPRLPRASTAPSATELATESVGARAGTLAVAAFGELASTPRTGAARTRGPESEAEFAHDAHRELVHARFAPLRCGGRGDERVHAAGPSAPAAIAESDAPIRAPRDVPERFETRPAELWSSLALATPSPPPRA
ncbi:MAG: hypothetical protein IT453_20835 [Planctomycetes bacterium]|nr:hypothetical protein [Planctomycetota bacterium]